METATPTVKIEDNDTNTGIGILYKKTFTKKFDCGQTKVNSTFYFNECYASVGVVTSDSCEIEISGYAEDYAYVKHSLYGHGDNVTTCSAGARNHLYFKAIILLCAKSTKFYVFFIKNVEFYVISIEILAIFAQHIYIYIYIYEYIFNSIFRTFLFYHLYITQDNMHSINIQQDYNLRKAGM